MEGRQSVLAALTAFERRFAAILIRNGIHEAKIADVLELAARRGVPVRFADGRELDALAHGGSHGGVLAVCSPKPRMTPEQLLARIGRLTEPALLLLLEGVDDARNLGFALRSAEALGAHAVLIKKHLWDFDAVEVARPASGAYERMPLVQVESVELLEALRRRGLKLIACVAGARRRMYDVDLAVGVILAIGGEKRGLSGAVRGICDVRMTIPTRGEPSSLALSHAAAIVLAEARRQRLAKDAPPPGL
ncbi:MAG: TrmH family RNA methyltransferase [Phycisphaerae bacterium]